MPPGGVAAVCSEPGPELGDGFSVGAVGLVLGDVLLFPLDAGPVVETEVSFSALGPPVTEELSELLELLGDGVELAT